MKYILCFRKYSRYVSLASPMILSVDKGKFKKVVFIENGKEAGSAESAK